MQEPKPKDYWTKNFCDYDQSEHGSFEFVVPKQNTTDKYSQRKPLTASMVCKLNENDDYYKAE